MNFLFLDLLFYFIFKVKRNSQKCISFKGRLHGRKIGYGLVKKGVRTSHFCPCKQSVPCFGGWVRTRVFSGFGAIDVYGPKARKNTGPYSFRNSDVSLRNNLANDMRSKKTVWLWRQERCWFQTIHCQRMFHMQARTKHCFVVVTKLIFQPCSERVRILKILPWTSIFSSDKLFPVSLSFC